MGRHTTLQHFGLAVALLLGMHTARPACAFSMASPRMPLMPRPLLRKFVQTRPAPPTLNMQEQKDSSIPALLRSTKGLTQPIVHKFSKVGDYTPDPSKADSRIALVIVAALSGTGYGAVKMLDGTLDSPSILALRFIIAACVLTPWALKCKKEIMPVALETGGWLSIGYIAQAVCLQTCSAGATAFLASLTTIVCPLIERLTGKRLDKKAWTATALAVLGAACLEFGGGQAPSSADLVGLLQPILFGIYLWKTENALEEHPDQGIPITAVQTSVVALSSVAWWGFWQQHGVAAHPGVEVIASTVQSSTNFVASSPTASLDSQQILATIKSSSSVVTQAESFAAGASSSLASAELPEYYANEGYYANAASSVVDAMMRPLAQLPDSIEASSQLVRDDIVSSKMVLPNGVSAALAQEKLIQYGPKALALAWLGVLSSAAVLVGESVAVAKLSSSETAVVFSTEPLWAAAVGSIFVGEQVGANTLVGGALVLAACFARVATPKEAASWLRSGLASMREEVRRRLAERGA
jgi:drug/metabolite transporter (DMT)-like permease